jgi:exodeoxyribonuclease V alpha subunit
VVRLTHTWRFGGAIGELAAAIRTSRVEEALEVLRRGDPAVRFVETDLDAATGPMLAPLADAVVEAAGTTWAAARRGDAGTALGGLERHRLLCAHRRGPYGVTRWGIEVERWLAAALAGYGEEGEWYPGRPLLVTANDYELNLFNGDLGVVVGSPEGPRAAFGSPAAPQSFAPVRLSAVQTVHAMTVHRAQGSQFGCVSFVLPPPDSPLLTRELLYTAVTRATDRVQIFGTEEAVRRAIERPASRASGLRRRLV